MRISLIRFQITMKLVCVLLLRFSFMTIISGQYIGLNGGFSGNPGALFNQINGLGRTSNLANPSLSGLGLSPNVYQNFENRQPNLQKALEMSYIKDNLPGRYSNPFNPGVSSGLQANGQDIINQFQLRQQPTIGQNLAALNPTSPARHFQISPEYNALVNVGPLAQPSLNDITPTTLLPKNALNVAPIVGSTRNNLIAHTAGFKSIPLSGLNGPMQGQQTAPRVQNLVGLNRITDKAQVQNPPAAHPIYQPNKTSFSNDIASNRLQSPSVHLNNLQQNIVHTPNIAGQNNIINKVNSGYTVTPTTLIPQQREQFNNNNAANALLPFSNSSKQNSGPLSPLNQNGLMNNTFAKVPYTVIQDFRRTYNRWTELAYPSVNSRFNSLGSGTRDLFRPLTVFQTSEELVRRIVYYPLPAPDAILPTPEHTVLSNGTTKHDAFKGPNTTSTAAGTLANENQSTDKISPPASNSPSVPVLQKNATIKSASLSDDGSILRSYLLKVNSSQELLSRWESVVKNRGKDGVLYSTTFAKKDPFCICKDVITCNCCLTLDLAVFKKEACLSVTITKPDNGTQISVGVDNVRQNINITKGVDKKVKIGLDAVASGDLEIANQSPPIAASPQEFCGSASLNILGVSFSNLPLGCYSVFNSTVRIIDNK